jgi:Protein of unknown function (DUF1566)
MKKRIITGLIVAAAFQLGAQLPSFKEKAKAAPKARGDEYAMRYIDNNDGTVTDGLTGLMWTKNANHGAMSWSNAVAYCDNLVTNGYSDWRMPSVSAKGGTAELDTLFRKNKNPSGSWQGVAEKSFTGVQTSGSAYWSRTSCADDPDRAYGVFMSAGGTHSLKKASAYYVWPVRGGN